MVDNPSVNQPPGNGFPRKRLTIGVIVDNVAGESRSSLWPGIADTVQAQGGNLLCFAGGYLRDPHNFSTQSNVIYELIDKDGLDGLIIWTSALSSYVGRESIRSFCEHYRPLPIVSIGLVLEGIPSVVLDSYQGMRDAMIHLIEVHGRRHLAFIRGPEGHRDAEERYRAYVDVLKEYDLPFVPDLVSPHYKWIEPGGQAAMHLLLDQRQVHFDAVAAVNDASAIDAMEVLQARGIRVPEDVSVVGFNDTPSKVVTPPLTTIPWRMYERGRQAARLLLAMLAGEPVPEQVLLPTHLVVRQSCGCLDLAVVQAKAEMPQVPLTLSVSERHTGTDQPWAAGRGYFLAAIEQAIEEGERALGWAEQFLDTFLAELEEKSPDVCMPTLENILRQVVAAGGDVTVWQTAISTLRRQMLPFLLDNGQALVRAENIWHQARVLIGERARRAQAYREWLAQQQTDRLRRISRVLATATSVSELMDVLAEELPQSGIPSCYLALYENPEKPAEWSRLLLAYDEKERIELGADGWRFPSRQLATGGLLPPEKQYSVVIEPLYFQDEQLGFVMFERRSPGDVYEVLREEISSTLKAVMLVAQNVELYQKALEAQKAAQEGRRSAEEADRLKSRFLSMVSHELRTPLVLLVGLSEMMLRERMGDRPPLPEPYRQDLARIHVSAQQLDGLVRDVLDLTRSQMGQLKLVKKPLDLGEVLKAVALVGEEMARGKGLAWRIEIPVKLPRVWGDQMRLQQVALNLVTNAIKFTARGEVALKVEVGEGAVTVLVSDTGLGVPLAEQETIFDEFRQSERTAARGYGGLGVGLAICRQLVELHGGQIRVRSSGEEDSGSTFYFTLPAIKGRAAEEPGGSARVQTVLLLTERASSGMRLQEHLVREGFEVETLCVDETADWLSQALMSPPGAVVLDLPASERGWEIVQTLKENPTTQAVPVLFYSLLQDSGSVLALDYLTKPMGAAALAQALQRHGLDAGECEGERAILVVDDDPMILEMHTRIVQAHLPACRVLKATNGWIALEVMRRERPALVLLDLMMPELDGFGVLEAMQQDAAMREIPVIVLTAQTLTQPDMARLNRGVTTILEKGLFNAQETLAHIEQALAQSKNLGGEAQRIVRKVMAYIHEHYADPISRKDMAAYAGVSVRHLTRCFRQEVGVSSTTYLNRYRVKQAKQLLRRGDKNVTQVAGAVGFSDSGYFARVFRRETGVSPRAYQQRQQL